ncbi:response regulator [Ramlibacter sp.]|uniref:response regulator n=1 Tax=Ramlibacter sp. TaxID=1917967 RepID=UPI0017FC60DE|nr:response regulator [Ramlibacter sp.]MBA2676288.1 response regulator transcription factor [Ramlibacter sp.]
MNIRVALVDPHAQYRQHLAGLLARESGIAVVSEASGLRSFSDAFLANPPGVVLFDIDSPAGGGIAALARVAERHPGLRIVALCLHDEPRLVAAALAAGACACVRKDQPFAHLLAAIHASARGSAN